MLLKEVARAVKIRMQALAHPALLFSRRSLPQPNPNRIAEKNVGGLGFC